MANMNPLHTPQSAPATDCPTTRRMGRRGLSAVGAAAMGLALWAAPEASAHDDDPKVLDRQPAVKGTGYRRVNDLVANGALGAAAGATQLAVNSNQGFPGSGFVLESWLTLGDLGNETDTGNDCWGYVSPSGREYALMGTSRATIVVEITDPGNAQVVERIQGPTSIWRDIKVYQDRAYSVSEGGGGIQIINLSNVDSGVVTLETSITGQGTDATHNVVIDEDSGFLYRCGGGGNGLRIYSLQNPGNPQFVGQYNSRYVHDAQVVTYTDGPFAGRQVAFCCAGFNNGFGDTGLTILDVTNKANIQTLSQISYPNAEYSHQGWLSEDKTRFYLGDELDENNGVATTVTRVFDVTDLNNASFVGTFENDLRCVSHNMYERDGFLFQANYTSGLRVFDVGSDSDSPAEVAFFDTAPDRNTSSFNGLWSCFPYFPSGAIIGSDVERGLFVLSFDPLRVDVTQAGLDAIDVSGEVVTAQFAEYAPGNFDPMSPELVVDDGSGPVGIPMATTGAPGEFTATLPGLPCGTEIQWYVTARTVSGVESTFPLTAPDVPYVSFAGQLAFDVISDNMQDDTGWTGGAPGDTASTGVWVRGIPTGTDAQPLFDNTELGRRCWFTGQGTGGGNGENDVDGGFTTLLSPIYDLSANGEPTIEYYRWYSNNVGNGPADDSFVIEISNDGGSSWITVENIGPGDDGAAGGWCRSSFLVSDLVTPTSQVQMRFIASDTGAGSIVEAAIDDFRVVDALCDQVIGVSYCVAAPNSTGVVGEIEGEGTNFVISNDLELVARDLPQNQFGFFVVSADQAFVPNPGGSQGNLCVGTNTGRYLTQIADSGTAGRLRLIVNTFAIAQPTGTLPAFPGDTWNFQCWHRDLNPGATSNLTRGYSVTFR